MVGGPPGLSPPPAASAPQVPKMGGFFRGARHRPESPKPEAKRKDEILLGMFEQLVLSPPQDHTLRSEVGSFLKHSSLLSNCITSGRSW